MLRGFDGEGQAGDAGADDEEIVTLHES
jgi:hypothetical protein